MTLILMSHCQDRVCSPTSLLSRRASLPENHMLVYIDHSRERRLFKNVDRVMTMCSPSLQPRDAAGRIYRPSVAHLLHPAHPHDHLASSPPPFTLTVLPARALGFSCTGHNHSTPMTVLFQNAFYVGNTFNGILYGELLSWLPPRRGGGARKR